MIIPSFFPTIGGTENQVQTLSQVLLADNWSVRVLTRQHNWAFPTGLAGGDMVVNGTPVTRLYSRGFIKIGSVLYLLGGVWYLLHHGRRGIYHAHDVGAAGFLAVIARYLLGGRSLVKLRTGCHGYQGSFSSKLSRWQFVALLRLADRIVVVNRELERMVHNLGITPKHVVRIPNAVDTGRFYPASIEEKMATRQRLGFPIQKAIFLYVGRLAQYKGVDILLRAWSLLPSDIRLHALLVLVGDGPERDRICQLVTSLKMSESVLMMGMQQHVRDYYWAADIFVLASETEGLSNTLIEAMACGLPVVASNVDGNVDLIEDGRNGQLFESGNFAQLSQKMISLLSARAQWVDIGLQARQRVMMHADLPSTVSKFRELYCQLIQEMG